MLSKLSIKFQHTTTYSITLAFANTSPADVFIDAKEGNGNLINSKEIYLVQVNVVAGTFTPGKPNDQDVYTWKSGVTLKAVSSQGTGGHGLDWNADITLKGPGANLGVDKINVGFIQHINFSAWTGY